MVVSHYTSVQKTLTPNGYKLNLEYALHKLNNIKAQLLLDSSAFVHFVLDLQSEILLV